MGRTAAGPAPRVGNKKQIRGGNALLITVCIRQPLSKEFTEDAQWSVGTTSSTALRPPSRTVAAHTRPQKGKKQKKNTAAGCGCVCVALRVSAGPRRNKNKTRGKEMCAPPHRPSSHAHTSRLPQRAVRRGPSSCVQQARRTGPSS
ncbi:hypothetical protein TcCL_Unassigned04026 [Trypanosoma cruzi]|nr:hypothetical protein TcCL_Unassigned04026 [Trypanosoma cruzi]